ncbi:hypothetical protein DCC39_05330 [Pueribacillus theae]|uniref:HlyD family secretion protein n=1 Tax=Pueribacillus theae TaxID=2171751 RepID=A0A2U1K620_9BACI|nr:efflux RND transporter periplasmic adaptor subunit [Pueribacillus theae]PWA12644.1 hypothetical protein DCC39_05330 [Pueribacillus theae]
MKAKRLIWAAGLLLICLNIFLIVKDKDGKVERVVFVKEWNPVAERDLAETLQTEGVIDSEKELVYFDEGSGAFGEFLVSEGDEVSVGSHLYTYEVRNYAEMKASLERDIAKYNDEIKAIETAIKKMQGKQVQLSDTRVIDPNGSEAVSIKQNTTGAEMMKEQFIIHKEAELEQVKAQLKSAESQLADMTAGSGEIQVPSPYSGKVTKISASLANPIMAISSPTLGVAGELSEKERMKVEDGMKVSISLVEDAEDSKTAADNNDAKSSDNELAQTGESAGPNGELKDAESSEEAESVEAGNHLPPGSDDADAGARGNAAIAEDGEAAQDDGSTRELTGVIHKVSSDPKQVTLHGESIYPFQVAFDDGMVPDDLLRGYHVNLDITISESLGARAVRTESIHKGAVWKMTNAGKLKKQPVETGIEMADFVELVNGPKIGDLIVAKPGKLALKDGAAYITPLKPGKATWKEMVKSGPRKRSLVIGLLTR